MTDGKLSRTFLGIIEAGVVCRFLGGEQLDLLEPRWQTLLVELPNQYALEEAGLISVVIK